MISRQDYWCVENNYELEQALAWADRAISFRVMGEKNFRTLQAKAAVLDKMNRGEEAKVKWEATIRNNPGYPLENGYWVRGKQARRSC